MDTTPADLLSAEELVRLFSLRVDPGDVVAVARGTRLRAVSELPGNGLVMRLEGSQDVCWADEHGNPVTDVEPGTVQLTVTVAAPTMPDRLWDTYVATLVGWSDDGTSLLFIGTPDVNVLIGDGQPIPLPASWFPSDR